MISLRLTKFFSISLCCLLFLFGLWWQDGCQQFQENGKKATFPAVQQAAELRPSVSDWSSLGNVPISEPIPVARQIQCSDWPSWIKCPPPEEAGLGSTPPRAQGLRMREG